MAGLGLLNKPALAGEVPKLAQETGTGTPIFVSDLSRCQPSTALSKVNKKQHWTLIDLPPVIVPTRMLVQR